VKRGDPEVLRLAVKYLRARARMTQEAFGKAARVDQGNVSRYEIGQVSPAEDSLRRMAAVAKVPWPVVMSLCRFYAATLSAAERADAGLPSGGATPLESVILDAVLLAVSPYLVEERTAASGRPSPEEALREAAEVWATLEPFPPARRRRLIELSPCPSGYAALVLICEASERAAAHKVEDAQELADFALFVAGKVSGEGRRARAEGYCWAHVANARRVATDFDAADAAFARAWDLWRAGDPSEPELLAEWRLYDLEASLRREQRRFAEALECLDRAFALCGGQPAAAGRILLKREHVFEAKGDVQNALVALEEAAPFVEAAGDANLLFTLRFSTIKDLCHLERYEEAAKRLPAVREMAIEQGKALHLTRVVWLSARVEAGQGRTEEAIALLQQVARDFTVREQRLPYEAALASLDLAVLLLEAGRTAEVRQLALGMAGIFAAKGIAREALAALTLFCEAAREESATVELAKRVIAEVERAWRSAPPT
jgi:transcriptional regulator with XRE-family HTH domain